MIDSLEFNNLPLAQVDLRLRLSAGLEIRFPGALEIRDRVKDRFPGLISMDTPEEIPTGPALQVVVDKRFQDQMIAVGFGSSPPGIVAVLHRNMLSVRWIARENGMEYPHYERLLDDLTWFVDHVKELIELSGGMPIEVVQMRYSNFIRSDDGQRNPSTWFLDPSFAKPWLSLKGTSIHIDAGGRIGDSCDVRVMSHEAATAKEDGVMLQTTAGMIIESGSDWIGPMNCVHANLQTVFERILSKEAKEKWQLKN